MKLFLLLIVAAILWTVLRTHLYRQETERRED